MINFIPLLLKQLQNLDSTFRTAFFSFFLTKEIFSATVFFQLILVLESI